MTDSRAACNMDNFVAKKYFEQHELGPTGPIFYEYKFTRSFEISAETTSNMPGKLDDLSIVIASYKETIPNYGTPHTTTNWEDKLRDVLVNKPLVDRTSLDFALSAASRVILVLSGDFWRFSNSMEALTTKFDLGAQYFDLQRHRLDAKNNVVPAGPDDDCRCISFFADEPCPDSCKIKHGFSLNVELVHGGKVMLPITIDPDIENKGGNHPIE